MVSVEQMLAHKCSCACPKSFVNNALEVGDLLSKWSSSAAADEFFAKGKIFLFARSEFILALGI